MSKQINTRVQHKIDTTSQWVNNSTRVPLLGELIIYSDATEVDGASVPKFKVGNGSTSVGELPFASADVKSIPVDAIDALFK